jgi:hypothetical protein
MPPAAAIVGLSAASPDSIEASLRSSQQSDDPEASTNEGGNGHGNVAMIDVKEEIQTISREMSHCKKRRTPLLSNADDEEEGEEKSPISSKKRRGINDDEELDEDDNGLGKENNGHNRAHRKNNNRRNKLSLSSSTPTINSSLNGHRNVNAVGKPPEAGIILKIYVENFMCHRKLTVDLCRNVNFIYGQNGSGKVSSSANYQLVAFGSILLYLRSHQISCLSSDPPPTVGNFGCHSNLLGSRGPSHESCSQLEGTCPQGLSQ